MPGWLVVHGWASGVNTRKNPAARLLLPVDHIQAVFTDALSALPRVCIEIGEGSFLVQETLDDVETLLHEAIATGWADHDPVVGVP